MTSSQETRASARPAAAPRSRRAAVGLGLLASGAGVTTAYLAHHLVPQFGILTWAVAVGAVAANVGALPHIATPGIKVVTRKPLRIGVALLGLSLPLSAVAALGPSVIGLVMATLVGTLVLTTWLGIRIGLSRPRSLLIGTGFAICGASAVAAMEENAEASEDDVTVAIAMVTICGTVAMVLFPVLQIPLGLTDVQLGAWAGAGVHEVGQVVAAASPAGAAAVSVAVAVKLTRVLMLAPVVATFSALRRRRSQKAGGRATAGSTPPLVPFFVLAFLVLVGVRSTGVVPESALVVIGHVQTATLGAALFGMGAAAHIATLARGSARIALLSALSTVLIGAMTLVGVMTLV